jgi:hypothetical protein
LCNKALSGRAEHQAEQISTSDLTSRNVAISVLVHSCITYSDIEEPSMPPDPEIQAMERAYAALDPLTPEARQRVLEWVAGRFDLTFSHPQQPAKGGGEGNGSGEAHGKGSTDFETFAELFDAVGPKTDPERALAGGYWHQVVQGAESFQAQPINTELKNLGHAVGNITDALSSLKERKPALVLQVQKQGSTKQARKVYKLTAAGKRRVSEMLNSGATAE